MSSNPSPAVAALLSFVFPGTGQIYAGRPLRGVLVALPTLLLVLGAVLVLSGTINAIGLFTNSQSIAVLLVLNIGFLCYHLAAMLDAYGLAQGQRSLAGRTARAPVALAVLVTLTVLLHGSAEAAGLWGSNVLAELMPGHPDVIPRASFEPLPTPPLATPSPSPSASPTGPSGSPGTTPTMPANAPTPQPSFPPIDASWGPGQDGRLNIVLLGADAGTGRSSLRTDTMMLLSVDVATGKAALFGFPRNLVNVPLPAESRNAYPGGVFPEMLSGLWRRAAEQPGKFPGSDGIGQECSFEWDCVRGWRAIVGAIQELAGVQVDGMIAVDFVGFVTLVDAVGGVWVDVPAPVYDERYHWSDGTRATIDIKAGCQKFHGEYALAYARSRHQDSDYQRMRRQQTVLQAVRRQFDPIAMLPRINDLLQAARDNLYTTFSQNDIQNLAIVGARVDADRLYQVRFTPRQVERLGGLTKIRTRVRHIFGEPEPEPTPRPSNKPASCPPR